LVTCTCIESVEYTAPYRYKALQFLLQLGVALNYILSFEPS
jgi:hypothetical protein